jgi:hypothetical protein
MASMVSSSTPIEGQERDALVSYLGKLMLIESLAHSAWDVLTDGQSD